jgi:hypothetical protein
MENIIHLLPGSDKYLWTSVALQETDGTTLVGKASNFLRNKALVSRMKAEDIKLLRTIAKIENKPPIVLRDFDEDQYLQTG